MAKGKVVDLMTYKSKNVKGSSSYGSSFSLTLDTCGPAVDVSPVVSTYDGTVSFDFTFDFLDVEDLKTWGDYDTSPGALNPDKCSRTESSAPWIDPVSSIEFSLLNVSSPTHDFYFKFRDDVWNETYVPLEDTVEHTRLIDAFDFTDGVELYTTLIYDSESGILDSQPIVSTFSFDSFYYEEAVTDPSSDRPICVFGFEYPTSREFSVLLFPVTESASLEEDLVYTVSGLDSQKLRDWGWIDGAPFVLFDRGTARESHTPIAIADIQDRFIFDTSSVITLAENELAQALKPIFYYTVLSKEVIDFVEHIDFWQIASDHFSSIEYLVPRILGEDAGFTEDLLVEKAFDSTDVLDRAIDSAQVAIPVDSSVSSYDVLDLAISATQPINILEKAWNDADLYYKDLNVGTDLLTITLPQDHVYRESSYAINHLAFLEGGHSPDPDWEVVFFAKEVVTFREDFENTLLGSDWFGSAETSLLNSVVSDFGVISYPAYIKEFDTTDSAGLKIEQAQQTLLSTDHFVSKFDILLDTVGSDLGKGIDLLTEFSKSLHDTGTPSVEDAFISLISDEVETTIFDLVISPAVQESVEAINRTMVDADLIQRDYNTSLDRITVTIPVDDYARVYEDPVISLFSFDDAIGWFHIDIEAINPVPPIHYIDVFDDGVGFELPSTLECLAFDYFTSYEQAVISMTLEDSLIYSALLIFEKIIQDWGKSVGQAVVDLVASGAYLAEEDSVIAPIGTDVCTSKDLLTEFWKNLFDFNMSTGESAVIVLSESQFTESIEKAALTVCGDDFGVGRDLLIEFSKNLFDGGVGADAGTIQPLAQDFGLLNESIYAALFSADAADGEERQRILVLLDQKDEITGVEFDTVTIPVESHYTAFDETYISLYLEELGLPDEYCYVDEGERRFTVKDDSIACFNTVIYDPTITQRDLIYWWEPGYVPGGKAQFYPANPINVNPKWGDPIKPGDADYPYYKDDPRYGVPIPFYDEAENRSVTTSVYDSWYGDDVHSWHNYKCYSYSNINFYSPKFELKIEPLRFSDRARSGWPGIIGWSISDLIFYVRCYHYDALTDSYTVLPAVRLPLSFPFDFDMTDQHWSGDRMVRYTTYQLKYSVFREIDCYALFPGYDLTRDYFTIYIYLNNLATQAPYFRRGFQYFIDYFFTWNVNYSVPRKDYLEARRQLIYDNDEWFATTDVLYYEPMYYKLYINMGCGPLDAIDRPPTDLMDKFVLDKMTKYSKLDIVGLYPGDHADTVETSVISLFDAERSIGRDVRIDDRYIDVRDYSFYCEDILIYSESDFQQREFLFWWNADYPTRSSALLANDLLGEPIRPGDFDYPYAPTHPDYGKIIEPEFDEIGRPAKFAHWGYHFDESTTSYDYASYHQQYFFPLQRLTDGIEFDFSGDFKVPVGTVRFAIYAIVWRPDLPEPTEANAPYELFNVIYDPGLGPSGVEFRRPSRRLAVIKTITAAENSNQVVHLYNYHLKFRCVDFDDLLADARMHWDKYEDVTYRDIYFCFVPYFTFKNVTPGEFPTTYSIDFDFSLGTYVSQYSATYLRYRSKTMPDTDLGFITTDFYEDLFKFKLYVNLGCGPDVEAFPIEPKTDFERWILNRARRGNANLDYLFLGDFSQSSQVAVEEVAAFDYAVAKFIVIFNDREFYLFESGHVEYDLKQMIIADDQFRGAELDTTITMPEVEYGYIGLKRYVDVIMTLFESGEITVTPLFSLFTREDEIVTLEEPIVDIIETEIGALDCHINIDVKFTVRENIFGVIKELMSVPMDGFFYSTDDVIISPTLAVDVESGEHADKYEFIFVYDEGLPEIDPCLTAPVDSTFTSILDSIIDLSLNHVGIARENVRPDRNERYFDVGYVCFWVQLVDYPYVIDWLAGHYVDYFVDPKVADYFRFTTCFGVPPGGWPPVKNYPADDILPDPSQPHLVKDPKHPEEGYRWRERQPKRPDRKHGWIRYPIPGGTAYIIDPTDPPGPYVWNGGTAAIFTKSIFDSLMENLVIVKDAFYFMLFDEDGNPASDVKCLTFKDTRMLDGTIIDGAGFGAMIFYDLVPGARYFIKETDADGNPIVNKNESEFTHNTYLLPQEGLEFTAGEEGKCVDAGEFVNIVDEIDTDPTNDKPLPAHSDNYNPVVYPDDTDKEPRDGEAPFVAPGHGDSDNPDGSWPPSPIEPRIDSDYFPPIIPPFDVVPDDDVYLDVPGSEGRLINSPEFVYARGGMVTNIPVDMLGVIWELHFIPATFILELSGIKLEFLDGFDVTIEEPFRFTFDGFDFEIEEPFRFDATEFLVTVEPGFLFDEDPLIVSFFEEPFTIEETRFEFEAMFEDFTFDEIYYDGEQIEPVPEVVASYIVYDGDDHELISSRGSNGVILYQVDDGPWSTEIPVRSQSGSYIVKWYAMASFFYQGYGSEAEPLIVNCYIQKAYPYVEWDNLVECMYNETALTSLTYVGDGELSIASNRPDICTCEIVSIEPLVGGTIAETKRVTIQVYGVSAGETELILHSDPGRNYLPSDFRIRCVVSAMAISFVAHNMEIVYTGEPVYGDIEVLGVPEYKIYYSDVDLHTPAAQCHDSIDFDLGVGEYNIYFMIVAPNCEPAYGKFKFVITRAMQDITLIPYFDVYDGEPHNLIVEAIGVYGTLWYSMNKQNWSADIPQATLPGLYDIYWYCVGDENHYDTGTPQFPNVVMATVDKITPHVFIPDQELDLGMTDWLEIYVDTPSTGEMVAISSDVLIVEAQMSGHYVKIRPAINEGETYVLIKQAEDEFYKAGQYAFMVRVRDALIIYTVGPVEADYNGAFITDTNILITRPDPSDCTIRFTREPTTVPRGDRIPAFYANAGTYTIYFSIVAPKCVTVFDSYELTINPIANPVDVSPVRVVYDGFDHELLIVEPGYFGTIMYSFDRVIWQSGIPHAVLPDSYDIYWYCAGDGNHVDVGSRTNPFLAYSEIEKCTIPDATINLTVDIKDGESIIPITTPSDGRFDTSITYQSVSYASQYVDINSTFVSNIAPASLHILPIQVGSNIIMYVHQREGALYKEHWFTYVVDIVDKRKIPVPDPGVIEIMMYFNNRDSYTYQITSPSTGNFDRVRIEGDYPYSDFPTVSPAGLITFPVPRKLCEYTMYVHQDESDIYLDHEFTFHVKVCAAIVPIPSVSRNPVYTGGRVSPELVNYDSDCVLLVGNTAVNAGDYTLTYKLLDPLTYVWEDGTTENKTENWAILKANGFITLNYSTVVLDNDHRTVQVDILNASNLIGITVTSSDPTIATVQRSGSRITVSSVNDTSGSAFITVNVAENNNYYAYTRTIPVTASFVEEFDEYTIGVRWQTIADPALCYNVPGRGGLVILSFVSAGSNVVSIELVEGPLFGNNWSVAQRDASTPRTDYKLTKAYGNSNSDEQTLVITGKASANGRIRLQSPINHLYVNAVNNRSSSAKDQQIQVSYYVKVKVKKGQSFTIDMDPPTGEGYPNGTATLDKQKQNYMEVFIFADKAGKECTFDGHLACIIGNPARYQGGGCYLDVSGPTTLPKYYHLNPSSSTANHIHVTDTFGIPSKGAGSPLRIMCSAVVPDAGKMSIMSGGTYFTLTIG